MTTRPNPDAPIIGTAPHELRANLNFSERGLSNPMAAYWALCGLMRQHGGGTTVETEIPWVVEPHPDAPVDDDGEPMEPVTISLYYGSDDDGNPAGKIAPHPEFDLSQDRGMWEPRINVEGFGERKADFHVRPRYAGMEHVDTRNDIASPFDHDDQPDRGYNVNVQGSNLEPDEYLHVLQEACKALAEEVDENWGDDRFTNPLPTSTIIQYERYLRLSRKLSEKLTREGGTFHQLAMLLSDQAGSKGAYFWDNRDVQGYMSRFLHDSTGAGTMIPGHQYGGQLKSYHPENVHSDPSDPLFYPKFGALYTQQMNEIRLNDSRPSWSDRHDLGRELEERLVNVLAWSGIPIDPDALGAESEEEVGAFVEDWHFRAEATDLDPELADDPTPEIERSQESMIVRSLQRMTDLGLELSEQLIADGGHAHYEDLADDAEVSASTVYRWLQRMGEAVESDNGVITFHSANLREQFEEIVGRTATKFVSTIDNAMRRADTVLEKDAYQRRAGAEFENWRQKWGAELAEDGRVLNLGTCLPRPDRDLDAPVDAGDVVRDGLEAWHEDGNKTGTFPHEIHWDDDRGQHHSERLDDLLEQAKKDHRSEAVQQLAEMTFAGLDVVDAISEVKQMIEAGSSWSPAQIQAAVEEAGFEFDVRDAAEPDFEIPETPG
ncbi:MULTISPECIES: DUF7845 domain-containing protein [Halolamina]|uniref:DUF7845 domain-containing protein n=1 Tax=Halolamina pelagica TaxID=699431 RepID=A0A1I5VJ94_9EURY|nr:MULTISPECIES: hypothetical protein [Halolamina]NHX37642.1 hypothetical protein [Halolamina sp. R1-12]SFQ07543.1 hypothetical protein SAMN05216277_11833 [Halolamina pelagica]